MISNPSAERALLGAVLLKPNLLPAVVARVGTDQNPFYEQAHAQIWEVCLLCHDIGRPIDFITLSANETVEPAYLAELVAAVPTSANWEHWADLISDAAYSRNTIDALSRESRSLLAGHDIEESLERLRSLTDRPPRARTLEVDDLAGWQEPPEPRYIIQDLCEEAITTVLTSPGGLGKSLFALGLGLSVATGRTLFPSFAPALQSDVLYISGEDPLDKVKQRLAGFNRQYGLPEHLIDGHFHLKTRNNRPFLQGDHYGVTLTPYYRDIQAYCLEKQPKLVILDTLRRCIGGIPGGENDNSVVGYLIESITDLVRPYGGMALVLSHSRKPSGDDQQHDITRNDARGASALVDEARTHFMLTRDPEGTDMLVTLTKANYAPRGLLYTTWRFAFGAHDRLPYLVESGKSSFEGASPEALIPSIVDYVRASNYKNNAQKLAQNPYCKPWRDSLQRKFPWAGSHHIIEACELAVKQGRLELFQGRLGQNVVSDLLRVPESATQTELYTPETYSGEPFEDDYEPPKPPEPIPEEEEIPF